MGANQSDMPLLRVFAGTGRSDRSARIDGVVREHWPRACLLLPTAAAARHRRERMFLEGGLGGALGPRVVPLTEFAEALLREEGIFLRKISDAERTFMLRGVLDELSAAHADDAALARHREQTGFVNHLLRVITDLKQATVEPASLRTALAKGGAPLSKFDETVSAAYEAYQESLKALRLYDVPGIYWEAHAACLEAKPRIFHTIDAIALDCFDDFTESELRFLQSAARHVKFMALGLHADLSPGRGDLFRVPRETLQRLGRGFSVQVAECAAPAPATRAGFVADHIFWRTRPTAPDTLARDLRVKACLTASHELEWIARDIKRRIVGEGTAPREIALIYRHPAGIAGKVRAVFAEYGIPLRSAVRPGFGTHAAGKLVHALFLVRETWDRGAVLDLVRALCASTPSEADCFALLAAHAQIIAGREEWKEQLEMLARRVETGRGDDIEALRRKLPDAAAQIATLGAALDTLAAALDRLPQEASMQAHARALEELAEGLALLDACAEGSARDAIWQAWRQCLRVCTKSCRGVPVSWEVFAGRLAAAMDEVDLPAPGDADGVRLLEPARLRGLQFRHVYLAHLIEGEFPGAPQNNAIYADAERETLRARHIPLESAGLHVFRERLLLHHVLEAGADSYTLTWPMLKADGRESTRSPFLDEITEILSPGALEEEREGPRAEQIIPGPQDAASLRELAQAALFTGGTWAEAFAGELRPARAGGAIESERTSARPFGTADACLLSEDVLEAVCGQFGGGHVFSATALETWLGCPFQFWMERVLRIDETELPVLEFDPRVRGTILHEVLEQFHRAYRGIPINQIPEEEGRGLLMRLVPEAFARHGWKSHGAAAGVRRVEEARVLRQIMAYFSIRRSEKGEEGWRPEYFEARFGRGNGGSELSSPAPLELEVESGTISLSGRIDRIDVSENGLRIVDYKSGQVPAQSEVERGTSVQLHVYKWAAEKLLLPGEICVRAEYVSLRDAKSSEVLEGAKPKLSPQEREKAVLSGIMSAVRGIQSGMFSPVRSGKDCRGCGRAHACRFDRNRVARKAEAMGISTDYFSNDKEEG